MKSTITLLITVFIVSMTMAQKSDFAWVKNTFSDQGMSPTVSSSAMIVKQNGDMYLSGSNGKLGNGVEYGEPCFAKYEADGSVAWVKYFPRGLSGSHTEWLVEDSSGDMIAMYEGSELDFDGNPTPLDRKFVVVKFDTAGDVQWVNYFGGNQITVREMLVTDEGNTAIIIKSQFVTADDTTITSNNIDILLVLDGSDGSFTIKDYAGYWPQGGFMTYNKAVAFGDNSIKVITHEGGGFQLPHTYLVEVDLDDNSLTVKDTMDGIFPPTEVSINHGTITEVLDFEPGTKIAYVSGRASALGVNVGNDSIFGVNPNHQSMFIAKMDFSNGDVLEKVVYYTPGNQEGVQRAVKSNSQITFFLVYRDTIRNTTTGDEYTSIDTLPNSGPYPHCLIQNFDLDLNLNYYNQSSKLGGISACSSAGYDDKGNLFMLYASGKDQYFDNFFINTQETNILARIGEETVGIRTHEKAIALSVYPNPTNSIVNVVTDEKIVSLRVVDASGRLVIDRTGGERSIDLSALQSGYYFMSIETDAGVVIKPIVKH